MQEKIRLLASRHFYRLSCHQFVCLKGREKFKERLLVDYAKKDGELYFLLENVMTKDVIRLDDPKHSSYMFDLEKGAKYRLEIHAKQASGYYKIKKIYTKIAAKA